MQQTRKRLAHGDVVVDNEDGSALRKSVSHKAAIYYEAPYECSHGTDPGGNRQHNGFGGAACMLESPMHTSVVWDVCRRQVFLPYTPMFPSPHWTQSP